MITNQGMIALRELAEQWGNREYDKTEHSDGYAMGLRQARDELFRILDAKGDGGAVSDDASDAERYRWLRNDPPVELAVRRRESSNRDGLSYLYIDGPQLDNEIDAAIKSQGESNV